MEFPFAYRLIGKPFPRNAIEEVLRDFGESFIKPPEPEPEPEPESGPGSHVSLIPSPILSESVSAIFGHKDGNHSHS